MYEDRVGYVSLWDARNRLVAMNSPTVSASFVYDALGRRISKTINGTTTQYQYDGNEIIAEIGGGAVSATYLRSLSIDEPFIRQSSINEFYHTDALGSTLALTDSTGAAQTTYDYDPFGNTSIIGSSTNPFQYTARENDGTGLYYYRERYYSPGLQRFISEDLIRTHGDSLYVYVDNNPLAFTDPYGLVHEGFIKQLRQLRDSRVLKTIRSMEKNIQETIQKLKDPKQYLDIRHHKHELRVFREQLKLARQEALRRGLKLGVLTALLADLLFPDELNAAELDELRKVCPDCVPNDPMRPNGPDAPSGEGPLGGRK